jgi:hypothetical protein
MKIRRVGTHFFSAVAQKNRHAQMTRLTINFRNLESASNDWTFGAKRRILECQAGRRIK